MALLLPKDLKISEEQWKRASKYLILSVAIVFNFYSIAFSKVQKCGPPSCLTKNWNNCSATCSHYCSSVPPNFNVILRDFETQTPIAFQNHDRTIACVLVDKHTRENKDFFSNITMQSCKTDDKIKAQ